MFTWIITHRWKITKIEKWVFTIENPFSTPLSQWQSIAHDGACMSITEIWETTYSFFAMEESFKKTNFGAKRTGDFFNLEQCLAAGQKLDGHFVTWHIDTTWTITKKEYGNDASCFLWVSYNPEYAKFVIKKWSIAINGVSLTVVDAEPWFLSVRLIPLTQELTNLWAVSIWDLVNLEFDMLGKYVIQHMEQL